MDDHKTGIRQAAFSAAGTNGETDIQSYEYHGVLPLTYSQRQLWRHAHTSSSSPPHVMARLRLHGRLDRRAIRAALDRIVARHEVLRTTFQRTERGPTQVVAPTDAGFALIEQDVESHEAIEQISRQETLDPFDLSSGPLIRGRLLRLSESDHALLITLHRIVSDISSLSVVMRELSALYSAFAMGRSDPLPRLKYQYADYANWQMQHTTMDEIQKQLEFWTRNLTGVLTLTPPSAHRPRGNLQHHGRDSVRLKLSQALARRVAQLARQQRVSLFVTFLTSWAALLARWCGQAEVVIGTRVVNRNREGTSLLVGPFENTVALRICMQHDPSVDQLLRQVNAVVTDASAHPDVPFEAVTEALDPVWNGNQRGLVRTTVNYESAVNAVEGQLLGLKVTEIVVESASTQPDLALSLSDGKDGLIAALEHASDAFERKTIERMAKCWETLLKGMTKHPRRPISRIALLPAAEREQVLYHFNRASTVKPEVNLIHALFEEQAERTPDATAVTYAGQSLTYAELNCRANQLARYLKQRGVRADQLVGICVERSLEMVAGLLAILKAGAAYVPLDPNYPSDRLAYMLEDATPSVVLTQQKLMGLLPATRSEAIALDCECSEIEQYPNDNLSPKELGPGAPTRVYVIYTSGSTGRPKGTQMLHRSMVNLIEWHRQSFAVTEGTRVLQFAALSFDVAFQEIFSTLCTGGTIVLLDDWVRRDTRALMQLLIEQSVQRLFLPPLMLQSLAEVSHSARMAPGSLQDVITAGEQLRITPQMRLFFKHLTGCRLHNHYGPTETHVVTALTLTGDPDAWSALPTIGRPIANTQIYVLDGHRQPVPIGVTGEIYIGGANVALGYLNRPELTSERFLTDSYSADAQARLYRTGDLGQWRADGTLEYLGRNDDQVKIRGFRIEPGEIELQLAQHAQVREAAVVAREDALGDKRLVAYVTLRDERSAGVEELRSHLKAALPEHMVPGAVVILESMPLTPSGKLDRRALPAPSLAAYSIKAYEPPRGEIEELLAAIWHRLLGVERIGRQDNFFGLGGNSLLMARMMEDLREAGFTADVRSVFESRTLAEFARVLTISSSKQSAVPPNAIPAQCEAITAQMLPLVNLTATQIEGIAQCVPGGAGNIQDIYPLAPLQEGLLFHHLLNQRGGDTYVVPTLLSVTSLARLDALIAAIQAVIDRHDALRTAVLWQQLPQPLQVVYRKAILPVEHVVLARDRDPMEQIDEWMNPEQQKIELQHAPLLRVRIAADPGDERWYVLLQMHHIIGDNTTQEIFSGEIVAHLQQQQQHLPEPLPYRNHVAYALASTHARDAETFFRAKLGDIDEPIAPFGIPSIRGDSSRVEEARLALDPVLTRRVHAQARHLNISPATLFHAAWGLVMANTSTRNIAVFGTVLLGRLQGSSDSQRMMGMFINTLPLRLRLQDTTTKELLEQAHRELGELLEHEQASLAVAQRCSGISGSEPLFTALLNFRHISPGSNAEWINAEGIQVLAHRERTNYPIALSVDDWGAEFALTAQTHERIDPNQIIRYLATALESLVKALERAPQTKALALPILPHAEHRQVTESFNATQREFPRQASIYELFEQQVARTPNAIAVVDEPQALTYAELNARANQLARYLCAQGTQIGELVPIVMDRSLQLLIAQLAVLKSGAAYVPIDPKLPSERQALMVRDCGARRILCGHGSSQQFMDEGVQWIDCAALENVIGDLTGSNLALSIPEPAAAYVMYTSGSTGVPKGVVVPHHGVVRLVINSDYARINPEDCIAHCSNPAFDASTFEIWAALLNGAKVLTVPQSIVLDAERFAAILLRHRVTVMFLTTGLFSQYIDALAGVFVQLRYLITGGDVLEPELVKRVLRNSPPQHLLNAYGPTESTTFATTYAIETIDEETKIIPIGRPISNTQVYVLNSALQPVPVGVAAEIFIGGAGVALGYLNRPELTAERFVRDPFSSDSDARLYRTGDLGRWRADGNIEFLGRNDQQVKLRGFRIELGEIESKLSRHPDVKEAAVIARMDAPGEKRLVAYVVPRGDRRPSTAELRCHLLGELPEYMVPSAIVVLLRLPLTANGKVNRRALPAPEVDAYVSRPYEPPRGDTEEIVALIWAELLHVERVGREDNFFELGGHSLLAMQVVVRIRSLLSVELPIEVLFDTPTLKQVSAQVEHLRDERMLQEVASGSDDIDALLEQVAAMSESRVQELMRTLRAGGQT